MTSAVVTPSGVPSAGGYRDVPVRAVRGERNLVEVLTYRVSLPKPAPAELRVTLEFGQEENGVWAHIPEFDITAEGESLGDAFSAVVSAARTWLTYLREDDVELAPELEGHERYEPLLDAPVFSWFKDFRFVD